MIFLVLIILHAPGGNEIIVNTEHITSLHTRSLGTSDKLITNTVHCAVMMDDGKFVSAVEECDTIKRTIEGNTNK